ncbi:MAG: GGDEF domain-containing protein, partial [Methylomonas sp.]
MNNSPLTLDDNDKLLYKLVIQFLIFNQGSHKLLEPHLVQIGKCLKKGASLADLTRELEAISKTLRHISMQTRQEVRIDDSDNEAVPQNDYLLSHLDELFAEPNVPLRFHQQAGMLRQRACTALGGQTYKKVVDSAIALLLNIRDYAKTEQQGIDQFLDGLATELIEIEQQAEIAQQANLLSIDNRDILNSAIHRQLDNMRDSAESAQELSTLKDHTTEHLDRLMQKLMEHKHQEDERQQQSLQQIEA